MKSRFTKIILIAAAVILLLCGCGKDDRAYPKSAKELDGLRAGAVAGTIQDQVIEEHFPNSEINYFTAYTDLILAIQNNKIDYAVLDEFIMSGMKKPDDNLLVITDGHLLYLEQGYIFSKDTEKGAALCAQMDEYIEKCLADGTIDRLFEKWTAPDAADTAEDLDVPENGPNGNLRMAISTTTPPFGMVKNGKVNGYDAEFVAMFCKEYGYGLEYDGMDFGGMIPAVVTGKDDIGGASITITPERKESVRFSKTYFATEMIAVAIEEGDSAATDIGESFKKTFITEDRWKMIVKGTLTTLLITFASALFGTIIGFLIFLLCKKGKKTADFLFEKISWVINGIPTVVLLLIVFYIIFGNSTASGILVSIIAFTVTTALTVCSMLKTSVKSVDAGQIEAAASMGFSDIQAFAGITIPQAMTQFIPNYRTMIVTLLKSTAIVGYIAVEDLTRVADVIRSRTYEAFFPIIVSAIIYLILIALLSFVINKIEIVFEPKKRSNEKILRRFEE